MSNMESVQKKAARISAKIQSLVPGVSAREGEYLLVLNELLTVCLDLQLQINALVIENLKREKAEALKAIEEKVGEQRN